MNFLNSLINFSRSRSDSNSKEISLAGVKEIEKEREIYTNEYFLLIKKKKDRTK